LAKSATGKEIAVVAGAEADVKEAAARPRRRAKGVAGAAKAAASAAPRGKAASAVAVKGAADAPKLAKRRAVGMAAAARPAGERGRPPRTPPTSEEVGQPSRADASMITAAVDATPRQRTAYQAFVAEQWAELKRRQVVLSFGEASKLISHNWRERCASVMATA
jgi:hypothetical protein